MPKLTIDGQEVEVPAGSTVLQACEAAGREIPRLLLPSTPQHRRQLPDVPGRDGEVAKADRVLRDAGRRRHGDQDRHAAGPQGAQGRARAPAHQPPARLPDLRPGRRVRPAGHHALLRPRQLALRREQAARPGQVPGPLDLDPHDPLHPLHAVHPLHRRDRRRSRARGLRSRRAHGDHAPGSRARSPRNCRATSSTSARSAR